MNPLFIDIETVPDESRLHLFDLPQAPAELPAPAELLAGPVPAIASFLKEYGPALPQPYLNDLDGYEVANKNRSGVTATVQEAREALARQKTELSVTPEFCKVAMIGYALGDGEPEAIAGLEMEAAALEFFWGLARLYSPIVGFNVIDFDLRVILIRSALLGVTPTRLFDTRPWGKDIVDLMKLRFPAGRAMGLKRLAKLYGFNVPVPDVDGSMVADLVATDPAKLREYVRSDIQVTRQLYQLYAGYLCEAPRG